MGRTELQVPCVETTARFLRPGQRDTWLSARLIMQRPRRQQQSPVLPRRPGAPTLPRGGLCSGQGNLWVLEKGRVFSGILLPWQRERASDSESKGAAEQVNERSECQNPAVVGSSELGLCLYCVNVA
ncbi:hypothetical protein SKAU_G00223580 [Synaphobranchus kaupii]|uniref:Uncharacterized protein n=1 Tax=Synaphobranchus kaupii TaxID=118154 RepID=A0A9Q1FB71_SYNKA|nr:hypothetical protein SKAU_G00223580 [Synaphobranchus kaupii]